MVSSLAMQAHQKRACTCNCVQHCRNGPVLVAVSDGLDSALASGLSIFNPPKEMVDAECEYPPALNARPES